MLADIHVPFLCQLSKSAPSFLWSVGNFVHTQPLQIGRANSALLIAKISVQSLLERRPRFPERWMTPAALRNPVPQPRK